MKKPRRSGAVPVGTSYLLSWLNGLLCGSISSLAIAIGIKYGRNSPEENPQRAWLTNTWLSELQAANWFRSEDGRGLKEYLTKVHDYACVKRLKFAVEKAIEILQE